MAVETLPQKRAALAHNKLRVVSLSAFRQSKQQAAEAADQAELVAVVEDILDRAKQGRLQGLVFVIDDTDDGRIIGQVGYGMERACAAASHMVHRFGAWMQRQHGIDQE
jgi:hypothetical protein